MLKARHTFSWFIYGLVMAWLVALYGLLVLVGLEWLNFSDAVLITFIATTTANALAFFVFVARYLFYRRKPE